MFCKMFYLIKHNITWLSFLIISLLTTPLFAQEQQKHINTIEKNISTTDTASIWQLLRHANMLRFKSPDSSMMLNQQALNKSKPANYTDGIARSLINISTLYIDKGDFSKSLDLLHIAQPYCEASDYKNGYYILNLYRNIAAIYVQKNMLDSAAYYYFEALKQFDQRKSTDTSILLNIYSNLGGTWVDDQQYDLALQYLTKAADIALKTKNDWQLGEIYTNMAAAHSGKKSYDTAISYGKQALILNEKTGNTFMGAFANYEIGTCYTSKNQPDTAINYYENALESGKNMPTYLELMVNTSLGEAYYQLKKYTIAEGYYLKVLNMTDASNYKSSLAGTYSDLADLYSSTNNYKLALKYQKLYSTLKDSTFSTEKVKITSQMEVKYRMSEKDKELAQKQLLLTKEQSKIRQKNILIYGFLGGIVLLGALLFTIYRGEKRKRKLQHIRTANTQKRQVIAQLKAKLSGEEEERVRIARELHDGIMVQFSSVKMNLSTILNHAIDPDLKFVLNNIVEQLDNATRELRKSAHNLMPDMLLEEGLIEAVDYFLFGLKQSSKIEIEFQQFGDIPDIKSEYELMLYRIIQELAQNAVKHAHATHILIQLNCRKNMLSITVEDNGTGFKEGYNQAEGIGIKNIRSRVVSLNGNMDINSKEGVGSTIYIEFDLHALQKNKN